LTCLPSLYQKIMPAPGQTENIQSTTPSVPMLERRALSLLYFRCIKTECECHERAAVEASEFIGTKPSVLSSRSAKKLLQKASQEAQVLLGATFCKVSSRFLR